MGLCGSKGGVETDINAAIADAMADDEKEAAKVIKVLLLGAGESGKSTLIKQMKRLYLAEYTDDERLKMKGVIHSNTITAMYALVSFCDKAEIEIAEKDAKEVFASAYMSGPDTALTASASAMSGTAISSEMAEAISSLWASEGVQEAFSRRAEFQLPDSAKYFLNAIDRITAEDYVPTVEDVLRSRVRTSGLIEQHLMIEGMPFVICDVGGQRNERRKWVHFFTDVTAVIFVAAISEYDQVLFEDQLQNRIVESVELFEEICTSPWFRDSAIILFLNKTDMLEEKIEVVDPATVPNPRAGQVREDGTTEPDLLWDDYDGGADFDAARDYFTEKFITAEVLHSRAGDAKDITVHATNALNDENVRTVWDACRESIVEDNVRNSMIME